MTEPHAQYEPQQTRLPEQDPGSTRGSSTSRETHIQGSADSPAVVQNDEVSDGATGTTRRTIVKGAAWSLPVIAMTVTVPAEAASLPPEGRDLLTFNGPVVESNHAGAVTGSVSVGVDWAEDLPEALITVTVEVDGQSASDGPHAVTAGSGHTDTWNFAFSGVSSGTHTVTVTAIADGFVTKTETRTVTVA